MAAAPSTATAPKPAKKAVLKLDRSRPFSTVHGERTAGDPHAQVHFFQNEFPFDAQGNLILDANLYTPDLKKRLDAKIKRLESSKGRVDEEEVPGAEDELEGETSDDVNLVEWLKGTVKYEQVFIFQAVAKRYSFKTQKLGAVVELLVFDEKLVPESEVAPALMGLVPKGGG